MLALCLVDSWPGITASLLPVGNCVWLSSLGLVCMVWEVGRVVLPAEMHHRQDLWINRAWHRELSPARWPSPVICSVCWSPTLSLCTMPTPTTEETAACLGVFFGHLKIPSANLGGMYVLLSEETGLPYFCELYIEVGCWRTILALSTLCVTDPEKDGFVETSVFLKEEVHMHACVWGIKKETLARSDGVTSPLNLMTDTH